MKNFYSISPTNHGWGYGYGFFSNYRVCLEQLILHHESGSSEIPYVTWENTTWVEGFNPFESKVCKSNMNPFDFWFDQQIPGSGDSIRICKSGLRPDVIDHAQHYFDRPYELRRQQSVDRLYNKPKSNLLEQIDEIYKREFSGHVVLGVMARGAEYNKLHPMYGIFNIDDYLNGVRKVLSNNPSISKIFLVSEESDYIDKLNEAFPNSYYVPNVFKRTDETEEYINKVHCWCNVSTKRKDHCRKLGEEVIIQTKLLGKCDYLFGGMCGVFCGAILWNENLKDVFVL